MVSGFNSAIAEDVKEPKDVQEVQKVEGVKEGKYYVSGSIGYGSLSDYDMKISDKQIAFFKDRGVIVGVSLDGSKEINDKNRVLNSSELGSYNIVISNLERLKKAGVKLSLSITLSHSFLDNEGILDWIISLGIPGIGYNLLRYNNKNDEWKGYYEKVSEFLFTSHEKFSDAGIREGRILRKIDEKKFKVMFCNLYWSGGIRW